MRSKLADLRLGILNANYDIIIITETWLRVGVYDSELADERYSIFRRDRDLSKTKKLDGGGIFVAIKKTLSVTRRYDLEDSLYENIILTIPTNKNNSLLLSVNYIPPKAKTDAYENILNKLHQIYATYPDFTYCIIGDFNIPDIEWTPSIDEKILIPSEPRTEIHKTLLNTMSLMKLQQYNSWCNENGRILDLVLSNVQSVCTKPSVNISPPGPHHPSLELTLKKCKQHTLLPINEPKYNYRKANYDSIQSKLSTVDWKAKLEDLNATESVNQFYNLTYSIMDDEIPLTKAKNNKFPFWFSPALKSSLNRKKKLWKRWCTYKNLSDYNEFALLRTRCKLLLTKCQKIYVANTEDAIPKNIKHFWRYVSSLKNNASGYPSTMTLENQTSNEPSVIAEMFSNFFSSVFEPSNPIDLTVIETQSPNVLADNTVSLHLDRCIIERGLKNLDITKGPGPDKISAVFLKNTYKEISIPLDIIYNKCLKEGTFPAVWKLAHVTPIHKSGSKSKIPNYRPISNLSTIPKLFESMVHDALYPIVRPQLSQKQHGFMKKRSVITNLLTYTNFLFEALDEGVEVHAIYTDFRKAFDKVDHTLLLEKLAFNGIKGNLLRWFASYLNNRYQIITINGYSSDKKLVSSGVVQGSTLGPLQYLLFINEIEQCFQNSNILMFADDLKIFKKVTSQQDCLLLQEDLIRFNEFCVKNKLQLAYDKCQQISFTRNINKIDFKYNIGDVALTKVASIRDLGVTLDEKLLLNNHIDNIFTKAYQMLGFVLRISKPFRKASTYLTLYQTLVRSHLDFASVIWNPFYAVYSNKIETIQKKFVRALHYRLTGRKGHYVDLLKLYNLQKLSDRRILLDAMTLYNICNNEYDCPPLLEQIHFRAPARSIRSKSLFLVPFSRTNAGARAPLRRICQSHNKQLLPTDIFNCNKMKFKKEVIQILNDELND